MPVSRYTASLLSNNQRVGPCTRRAGVKSSNKSFRYTAMCTQCRHSSRELSTSALAFIKSHPLMHDCVDTLDSRPLYFTKHDEAFTRLAVDYVAQYTIFFLASSKRLSVTTVPSSLAKGLCFHRRSFVCCLLVSMVTPKTIYFLKIP